MPAKKTTRTAKAKSTSRNSNKSLVIVESPAKARTISRILGSKYDVQASVGHIRDLPKAKLGIDVEQGFAPQYVIPRDKSKTVTQIKEAAKKAGTVYLATDPDREGEAIAWHLMEAANLDQLPPTGSLLICPPLKIRNGSGSPLRVLALLTVD